MYLKTLEKIADEVLTVHKSSPETQKMFDELLLELNPYILGFERRFIVDIVEQEILFRNDTDQTILPAIENPTLTQSDIMRLGRLLRGSTVLDQHRKKYMIHITKNIKKNTCKYLK